MSRSSKTLEHEELKENGEQKTAGLEQEPMKFDSLLVHIGEFGYYQKYLYALICLTAVVGGFHPVSIVFIGAVPEHWCDVPPIQNNNWERRAQWQFLRPPKDAENAKRINDAMAANCSHSIDCFVPKTPSENEPVYEYDGCKKYDLDYGAITNMSALDAFLWRKSYQNETTQAATTSCGNNRIVYSNDTYKSTVITEWDLVCGREVLRPILKSFFYGGKLFGSLIFGFLSDKIGRKITFMITVVVITLAGIGQSFVQDYWTFNILRFIIGAADAGAFIVAFVIGVELVGPKYRFFAGMFIEIFFSFGYISVALFAYFIRDWRWLQFALSVPWAFFICYWWLVPESARWLIAKGKLKRASKIIDVVVKKNGTELPDKFSISQLDMGRTEKTGTFLDLVLTGPRMRYRLINICFNWIVNNLVYYGLSLNSGDLGGNPFINYAISGAVEIPAVLLCLYLIQYSPLGRRFSLAATLILAGVSCSLTAVVPATRNLQWIVIVLAMIGKFAVTGSYAIVYAYTAELFPTAVRNQAVGAGSLFARIGSMTAPFILELKSVWKPLPLLIFGVSAIIAGLLSILFPETRNKNLPETLEDGENFGRKKRQTQSDVELLNYSTPSEKA